ncbi:MAG: putative metal-binding motif-containing protein [Alphaproteobacteria bacterium]|nr:putative metal-binding motif-containing protein [Alphaproteobacteria bacterium]
MRRPSARLCLSLALLLAPAPALAVESVDELIEALATAEEGAVIEITAHLVPTDDFSLDDCIELDERSVTLVGAAAIAPARIPGLIVRGGEVVLEDLELAGVCRSQSVDIGTGGALTVDTSLQAWEATLTVHNLVGEGNANLVNDVAIYVSGGEAELSGLELGGALRAGLLIDPGDSGALVTLDEPYLHDISGNPILAWGDGAELDIGLSVFGGRFTGNGSPQGGNASQPDLYLYRGTDAYIEGTVFEGLGFGTDSTTWPSLAGAIEGLYASLEVVDAQFTGYRGTQAGAIHVAGDGYGQVRHEVIIENSTFADCSTSLYGGAVNAQSLELARFSGLTIDGGDASGGAGIKANGVVEVEVAETLFSDFTVGEDGGAVFLHDVDAAELHHNHFCRGNVFGDPEGVTLYSLDTQRLEVHHNVITLMDAPEHDAAYVSGGALIAAQNTFDDNDVYAILDVSDVDLTLVNNLATQIPDAALVDRLIGLAGYSEDSGGNKFYELGTLTHSRVGAFADRFVSDATELAGPIEQIYWAHYLERDGGADDACVRYPLLVEGSQAAAVGEDWDGDGYADDVGAYGGAGAIFPDHDGDGYDFLEDCDDFDDSVHPGEVEIPYDGIDNNCVDGDLTDVDGDGFIAEQAGGDDCDDEDPGVHPGATEIPYDEVDQDCDRADLVDVDGDGVDHVQDCDDEDAGRYPGAEDIACDDIDQDCDGRDTIPDEGCGPVEPEEPTPTRSLSGGCGCDPSGGVAGGWLWLLAGCMLRRRRR